MRRAPAYTLALLVGLAVGPARAAEEDDGKGHAGAVVIDGERLEVVWNDGDTFKVTKGSLRKKSARLGDFNALESYGPVHRWGTWTAAELYALAKESGKVAAGGVWECKLLPGGGGYGRLLVACPDLARTMVEKGLALVFEVDHAADPALLVLQKDAMKRKAGIWAKGAPREVLTSVHSAGELDDRIYNRVVDTETGLSAERTHTERYETCQEVCVGTVGPGGAGSCMIYVPFERRYRDRPPCLAVTP